MEESFSRRRRLGSGQSVLRRDGVRPTIALRNENIYLIHSLVKLAGKC